METLISRDASNYFYGNFNIDALLGYLLDGCLVVKFLT